MKTLMSRLWIVVLICFLSYLAIIILLSLQSQSNEWVNPYPTIQVANDDIDVEWGAYNVLMDRSHVFRYRLNFSFPKKELEGHNLRSFRVMDILPSGISLMQQIEVRTVFDNVDVTEYFEIKSVLGTYDGVLTHEIVAREIALGNPKFYGEWADLYVEFRVMMNMHLIYPYIPYQESKTIDLDIPNSFRVVGEFYDGEEFDKTSNTVYTYYYLTFLPCGCYLRCLCDISIDPPPQMEE